MSVDGLTADGWPLLATRWRRADGRICKVTGVRQTTTSDGTGTVTVNLVDFQYRGAGASRPRHPVRHPTRTLELAEWRETFKELVP